MPDYTYWPSSVGFGSLSVPIQYRAAGSTQTSTRWTSGSSVLDVDGFCENEISAVSVTFDDPQAHKEVMLQWLRLAEPLLREGKINIDAFWRTLIGNRNKGTWPAPDNYGTSFARYLKALGTRGDTRILLFSGTALESRRVDGGQLLAVPSIFRVHDMAEDLLRHTERIYWARISVC